MLSVSLTVFILLYAVIFIFIAVFFLVNLFHLIHTGTITFWSTLVTLLVAGFMLFVLATTWSYLNTLDWQLPIAFGISRNNSSPL